MSRYTTSPPRSHRALRLSGAVTAIALVLGMFTVGVAVADSGSDAGNAVARPTKKMSREALAINSRPDKRASREALVLPNRPSGRMSREALAVNGKPSGRLSREAVAVNGKPSGRASREAVAVSGY